MKKMMYNINLPKWSNDLAYFCGLLIGDGSLPKGFSRRPNGKIQKRHEISFVTTSLDFIINIYQPLFEKLFGIKPYRNRPPSARQANKLAAKLVFRYYYSRAFGGDSGAGQLVAQCRSANQAGTEKG